MGLLKHKNLTFLVSNQEATGLGGSFWLLWLGGPPQLPTPPAGAMRSPWELLHEWKCNDGEWTGPPSCHPSHHEKASGIPEGGAKAVSVLEHSGHQQRKMPTPHAAPWRPCLSTKLQDKHFQAEARGGAGEASAAA